MEHRLKPYTPLYKHIYIIIEPKLSHETTISKVRDTTNCQIYP